VAAYFIALTLAIIWLFGTINQRLNRHIPQAARPRLPFLPQYAR
jgi:polar amino acid transport system permease protein